MIVRDNGRIKNLLKSFKGIGWVSIDIGFLHPSMDWDPHLHKYVPCNAGKHHKLVIQDGEVFNPEELSKVNDILDEAEIEMPLPEFYGEESVPYTLNSKNRWVNLGDTYAEGVFYVMFTGF